MWESKGGNATSRGQIFGLKPVNACKFDVIEWWMQGRPVFVCKPSHSTAPGKGACCGKTLIVCAP